MSEAEARKVVEAFVAGFNARDDEAIRRSLNYPHIRIASGRVRIIDEPSNYITPYKYLIEHEDWDHSTLDSAEPIHVTDTKAHFKIEFSRYKADGSKYVTHQALYIVTKQDGHWGLICRSSFAP
jgi:hypothetical protein